jgi:hypothetical protein
MKSITEYSLKSLLGMRVEALRGKKTPFTVKEINDESDRRYRLTMTIEEKTNPEMAYCGC